ncbi:uncharacterized protein G2W53_018091 [Senna tora]|uniref:Uncharacterized protein n=1 Tax=Senna tora TaxID=362788 RepID=A0A834WL19_9FABA|nr:uncharacterized protein G2W53_018091 [Senna tora]
MSSGRTGRGRGRGGVRSKTLPYTPLCSPPLIPHSSLSASTGQPQEPVEELQHLKNFKWLPQYEDRNKACWNFKADEHFRGLMKEVRLAWKEGQRPAWMPERCLHELGNIWLTEEYKKKKATSK